MDGRSVLCRVRRTHHRAEPLGSPPLRAPGQPPLRPLRRVLPRRQHREPKLHQRLASPPPSRRPSPGPGPNLPKTSSRRSTPHPALVTFFDLPKILTYKHKPGRDFNHLQSELLRLITLLDSLADASPPLLLKSTPDWQAIRSAAESATRKSHLKRLEDAIDSVVCAYIALYTTTHPTRTRLLGSPTTGQILVPVSPTQAHQIDHP